MLWTQQAKIRAGFWLVALVPILIGIFGITSLRSLFVSADTLARTNRTIQQLDSVYVLLSELEAAESEYIVTGAEAAVNTFHRVRARLDEDLKRLDELTAANKDQNLSMSNLHDLYGAKAMEMERTIELRASMGTEAAAAMLSKRLDSADGSTIADIRTTIRGIRKSEQERLDARTAVQGRSLLATIAAFWSVLLLNVGLVWFLWLSLRRETAEARREEERIRELNVELERRVEQRTEALRRSNEDLQQFAYAVSHDLQEPLRMVGTYTELLRRRYEGRLDKEADDHIGYAVRGVKRMTGMIRDLLEYSRAGQSEDNVLATVDPEEVLESVLQDLRAQIEEASAEVSHDPLPKLHAHRVWFDQIFQNLIGNALKYRSAAPPKVHVSASREDSVIVFSVQDNGIGIDPKYKDQVFGVFKRLHGSDVEGTGIGLATCKRIVERAGGRIWFESKPGHGSTFYFSMPATGD